MASKGQADGDASLRELFEAFDCDKDGKIARGELQNVFRVVFEAEPDQESISRCMRKYDTDNSGAIEFDEFVRLLNELGEESRRRREPLKKLFQKFDKDGDGKLTSCEIRQMLIEERFITETDPCIVDQRVNICMDKMDKNKDGNVTFDEFCQLFLEF